MRARRSLSVILTVSLAFLLASGACARQSEGERCDVDTADDCESGLVCTPGQVLGSDVDRCCPGDQGRPSDPRCFPGGGGTGGTGDGAVEAEPEPEPDADDGASGGAGGAEASEPDSARCSYNSDCALGLVCGP